MAFKVGDIVKIVRCEYPGNESWLPFVGQVGKVVGHLDTTYRVSLPNHHRGSDLFYFREVVAASDVDILAYKLGAHL